jgi:predicted phosphoribosyltransferase
MGEHATELRPDAFDEDAIVNGFLAQNAPQARNDAGRPVRDVPAGGSGRITADVCRASDSVAHAGTTASTAFRVEEVHQTDTESQARQHGSTILQHGSLHRMNSDATVVPVGAGEGTLLAPQQIARLHAEAAMESNLDNRRPFADRREAGTELAGRLDKYKNRDDVVVLALPRGGVPVAYEVARAIRAPLDVFLVRKLGLPEHPELAMGAIASGGVRVLNDQVVEWYRIPAAVIDQVASTEHAELERRELAYRDGRAPIDLEDRTVLLIDDGLATGSTMKAAVLAVRAHAPARIVVAVPVGAPDTCRAFADVADEIVCARSPERFSAVGQWYQDFSQTTDAEVRDLLHEKPEAVGRTR